MTDDGPPTGHIKLARKMFASDDDWLEARTFSRFEAWVYMIQLAAWKPRRYQTTKYGTIDLERGQFVASIRHLAERWQWTVKTVRGYLAAGEKSGKIRAHQVTQAGTVYLIVNYDAYQSTPSDEGTVKGTPRAHLGHKREAVKAVTTLSRVAASDSTAVFRLAPYIDAHLERFPGSTPPTGRYGRAFKKLEAANGAQESLRRWRICLDREGKFATPENLASHWSEYADAEPDLPIVDEWGCLTEYGERITRPSHV